MITCTLNGKKYSVDFVTTRVLREMGPALEMYAKITSAAERAVKGEEMLPGDDISANDILDVLVKWFCLLFKNQFTPDDIYDYYPADRIMHDIAIALMAVQTQTTEVLSEFPTTPTV